MLLRQMQYLSMFVLGIAIAAILGLFIRLIPETYFLNTTPRVLVFAFAFASGPTFVVLVRAIARKFSIHQRESLYVANTGAIAFDSLTTAFAPQFYGHQGPASHVVLAAIVFGLVGIFMSDQFIPVKESESMK